MRTMTIVIPVFMFVSDAALSQDQGKTLPGQKPSPSAPTSGTAIPQAPVGHRQPMQSDLPPAVRKDEEFSAQAARPAGTDSEHLQKLLKALVSSPGFVHYCAVSSRRMTAATAPMSTGTARHQKPVSQ